MNYCHCQLVIIHSLTEKVINVLTFHENGEHEECLSFKVTFKHLLIHKLTTHTFMIFKRGYSITRLCFRRRNQ